MDNNLNAWWLFLLLAHTRWLKYQELFLSRFLWIWGHILIRMSWASAFGLLLLNGNCFVNFTNCCTEITLDYIAGVYNGWWRKDIVCHDLTWNEGGVIIAKKSLLISALELWPSWRFEVLNILTHTFLWLYKILGQYLIALESLCLKIVILFLT